MTCVSLTMHIILPSFHLSLPLTFLYLVRQAAVKKATVHLQLPADHPTGTEAGLRIRTVHLV